MAIIYNLHPETPQERSIEQITRMLRDGAVMLYPTDTVYAIGCDLFAKEAIERVRQIKKMSNDKPLTFLCSSLSNIAEYAQVSDEAYRIMRRLVPGPYTFILPCTKLVPKLVISPKRKTTGIRVPDQEICQGLLKSLGNPIISTSAHIADQDGDFPTMGVEVAKLFDSLDNLVDVIIDDGLDNKFDFSSIIDFSGDQPEVVRQGLGWENIEKCLDLV